MLALAFDSHVRGRFLFSLHTIRSLVSGVSNSYQYLIATVIVCVWGTRNKRSELPFSPVPALLLSYNHRVREGPGELSAHGLAKPIRADQKTRCDRGRAGTELGCHSDKLEPMCASLNGFLNSLTLTVNFDSV